MSGHGEWRQAGKRKPRPKVEVQWAKTGSQDNGDSSRDLRQKRLEQGRCFECGETGHIRVNCPKRPRSGRAPRSVPAVRGDSRGAGKIVPAVRTAPGAKASAAAPPPGSGAKRPRPAEKTGLTPEAKQAKKNPTPQVTWGQQELVILKKDGRALDYQENEVMKEKFDQHIIRLLEKNEAFPIVDSWTWAASHISVKLPTMKDLEMFAGGLNSYKVLTRGEYDALKARTHRFIGKLGKSAAKITDEGLAKLIRHMRTAKGIQGRLEFNRRVANVPTGALIEIVVDDSAMEAWRGLDYTLHIGATGLVKFTEKAADQNRKLENKAVDLRRQIEEKRREAETLQNELLNLENEKEARIQLAGLAVEEDGENSAEAAVGEDTKEAAGSSSTMDVDKPKPKTLNEKMSEIARKAEEAERLREQLAALNAAMNEDEAWRKSQATNNAEMQNNSTDDDNVPAVRDHQSVSTDRLSGNAEA